MKCSSAANATVQYEVHINWTCSDGNALGGAFNIPMQKGSTCIVWHPHLGPRVLANYWWNEGCRW